MNDELVDVAANLARYAAMTQTSIDRLLARPDPNQWLDELVSDYPRRGGKGLRPAIMLATCQAFGGSVADAINAAAGLELLHNAFLIHDDIQDGSELRRGHPTLHRKWGMPLALNAGDALAMTAAGALLADERLSSRLNRRLADEFNAMTQQTIDGQAIELGWRHDVVLEVTDTQVLDMIGKKTCWYTTIYPLRVGALIGSRGMASLHGLSRFGYYLGAAFQIRDDLLNLVGSVERYGKELYGDIREGKRTLMLVHLLGNAAPGERQFVEHFLSQAEAARSTADVATVLELMHSHGSIHAATEYGQGIAAYAYTSFDEAFAGVPNNEHRRFLRALVSYMLEREV